MKYIAEVNRGMALLAADKDVLFVGQAVAYPGTAVTHQLKTFAKETLVEMPVAEEFQAGFCLGLALTGFIPVCIFPRFNFAILACNQIVNHIDKWPAMSKGQSLPKVIIKAVVGSAKPLDPGHQHKANYTDAFRSMCETIDVIDLRGPQDVFGAYQKALTRDDGKSTLLVEYGDLYSDK